MDGYITRGEHEEFRHTIDERDRRQDARIEALEASITQLSELTASVKDLAKSMRQMSTEQAAQGERLEALEKKPFKRLTQAGSTAMTALITAGVTAIVTALITWAVTL